MVSGRDITPLDNFSRNYVASKITPPAGWICGYLREKMLKKCPEK
jgi:hypothetical protein